MGDFASFFGSGFSFRDMSIFLHICGCLVLHCFLEVSLIYSLIIETKEIERFIMKVGTINACLFSCQFYYTDETSKHCAL